MVTITATGKMWILTNCALFFCFISIRGKPLSEINWITNKTIAAKPAAIANATLWLYFSLNHIPIDGAIAILKAFIVPKSPIPEPILSFGSILAIHVDMHTEQNEKPIPCINRANTNIIVEFENI